MTNRCNESRPSDDLVPMTDGFEHDDQLERLFATARSPGTAEELSLEAYQALCPAFEADVYQVFDPMKSVEKRNAIGGTSLQSVKNQIQKIKGE